MNRVRIFLTALFFILVFRFCDMPVCASSDMNNILSEMGVPKFDSEYFESLKNENGAYVFDYTGLTFTGFRKTSSDSSYVHDANWSGVKVEHYYPFGLVSRSYRFVSSNFGGVPVYCVYFYYFNTVASGNYSSMKPAINGSYGYGDAPYCCYFTPHFDVDNLSDRTYPFESVGTGVSSNPFRGACFEGAFEGVPIFASWEDAQKYYLNGDSSGILNGDGYSGVVEGSSLGYLSDVQYFVDTSAYLYDPENTPEYVKWGSKSTTGIDLTDSRYYVEFMCEDQSTFMRHNASDSFINETGVPFTSTASYIANRYAWASQYIFPSGSDQRALLGGKAAKTSLYGSASGLGSVPASAGMFKYSAAAQYKKALANDSDSDKGLIYGFINDVTSLNFTPQQKLFNNYQSSGKALNWTYNLYARIVDTTSGASGDWLKIDRHNAPWELGSDERQLNGGTTITTGHRFINYDPDTNVFVTLPDDSGDTYVNQPITTGYTLNGDYKPTYNNITNYNYNYYDYGDNINNINNIYVPYDNTPTNVGETISKGLDIAKFLNVIPMIFMFCFGPMLPAWIVPVVTAFFALVAVVGLFNLVRRLVGR